MSEVREARIAVPERSGLGESPWWDAERHRLVWVDIPDGLVHARDLRTRVTNTVRLGHPVGFVVGDDAGRFVVGTAAGLVRLDSDLVPLGRIGAPPDLAGRRINDGACDPVGRVLFGTVDPSGATTGTLWSQSADGACRAVVEGVEMSNGLGFSPDGRRLYHVDSLRQAVWVYPYDCATGSVGEREVLVRVPEAVGLPDGLAVDREGCIWLAIWGAGAVWRVTPDGRRMGVVQVPAARTTSCAFGGPDRNLLYVTTARDGRSHRDSAGRDRSAGAVFVADVGVTGAAVWTAATGAAGRKARQGLHMEVRDASGQP